MNSLEFYTAVFSEAKKVMTFSAIAKLLVEAGVAPSDFQSRVPHGATKEIILCFFAKAASGWYLGKQARMLQVLNKSIKSKLRLRRDVIAIQTGEGKIAATLIPTEEFQQYAPVSRSLPSYLPDACGILLEDLEELRIRMGAWNRSRCSQEITLGRQQRVQLVQRLNNLLRTFETSTEYEYRTTGKVSEETLKSYRKMVREIASAAKVLEQLVSLKESEVHFVLHAKHASDIWGGLASTYQR